MSILDKIKDVFKGETPEQKLRKAIEKGDAKKVKALLDAGVSPFVFFEDSEGITTPRALAKFYCKQSSLDETKRVNIHQTLDEIKREKIHQSILDKEEGIAVKDKHNVDKFSDYLDIENVIERAGRPLTKKEISRALIEVRAAREKENERLFAEEFGIDKVYSKEVRREATLAEKMMC